MSIKDRVRRLGKTPTRCPECWSAPPTIHAVYPGEEEPDLEYCPECGRPLGVIIRVVYDEALSSGAGGGVIPIG